MALRVLHFPELLCYGNSRGLARRMSFTHTICAVLGALILAGCSSSPPAPPPSAVVSISMDPSAWVFPYSPNMGVGTASPAPNGWQFAFPTQDGVHHAVTAVQGRLQGTKLTTEFSIQKDPGVAFLENQPCPPSPNVARLRLFMQQRGDDWSGSGKYEFYRWFSTETVELDSPTGLSVELNPALWVSVLGKNGSLTPSSFATAISDLQAIGFSFGGCFAAHGAYATGPATFTATTYRVE